MREDHFFFLAQVKCKFTLKQLQVHPQLSHLRVGSWMPFQQSICDRLKFKKYFSSELMMTLSNVLNQGRERLVHPILLRAVRRPDTMAAHG